MSALAANHSSNPDWFIPEANIPADVKQFLAWQATQPGVFSATIADDWEAGGTGPTYFKNVELAQHALAQRAAAVAECKETGETPQDAPWESFGVVQPTTGVEASEGGAAFGGS